jgi:hypothetical protein
VVAGPPADRRAYGGGMKKQLESKSRGVRVIESERMAAVRGGESGPSDANRILERHAFLDSGPSDSNRVLER